MTTASVIAAREAFRARRIGPDYSGPRHLATTVGLSLAVALGSILLLDDVSGWEWLTVPLTFLYANLAEYLGHRGPMHHRTPLLGAVFQRHSMEHHTFFTDQAETFDSTSDYKAVLFPPVLLVFFIVGFALPVGALLHVLVSPDVCYLFVATAVLYFLNYELLHFAYHSDPGSWLRRLPLIDRLRRHHMHHHDPRRMTRCNFNITYPLCDWLFGTLYSGGRVARPAEHRQSGADGPP